jgi:hypothetical protein
VQRLGFVGGAFFPEAAGHALDVCGGAWFVVPGICVYVAWLGGGVGAQLFPGHAHAQYRRGKEKGGSALSCIRGAMQLAFRLLKFQFSSLLYLKHHTYCALSQHASTHRR